MASFSFRQRKSLSQSVNQCPRTEMHRPHVKKKVYRGREERIDGDGSLLWLSLLFPVKNFQAADSFDTIKTMDEIRLRKASAKLQSFVDNLPEGDIEEKYVSMYHSLLYDIQTETGQDLTYFGIPADQVTRSDTSGYTDDDGDWVDVQSENAECDREFFMINLRGAINFVNSLFQERGPRTIGFS